MRRWSFALLPGASEAPTGPGSRSLWVNRCQWGPRVELRWGHGVEFHHLSTACGFSIGMDGIRRLIGTVGDSDVALSVPKAEFIELHLQADVKALELDIPIQQDLRRQHSQEQLPFLLNERRVVLESGSSCDIPRKIIRLSRTTPFSWYDAWDSRPLQHRA